MNTALLHALIDNAVAEFVRPLTKAELNAYAEMVRSEAGHWLMSQSKEMGSFKWVCNELGLDSETILDEVIAARIEFDTKSKQLAKKRAARAKR